MKIRMKRTLRDAKTGELLRRRAELDVTKARAKLLIDNGYAEAVGEEARAQAPPAPKPPDPPQDPESPKDPEMKGDGGSAPEKK